MRVVGSVLTAVAVLSQMGATPSEVPTEMSLRLELFADSIEESVTFYTTVLDFERLEGSPNYAPVKSGTVLIGIGSVHGLPAAHFFNPEMTSERKGLGAEIVLEVDDVEGYFEKVRASGYPILSPLVRRSWGQTDFRLADPDGYYLRITSRH